jgi:hypothetical protein
MLDLIIDGRVATVLINRLEKRNAMTEAMWRALPACRTAWPREAAAAGDVQEGVNAFLERRAPSFGWTSPAPRRRPRRTRAGAVRQGHGRTGKPTGDARRTGAYSTVTLLARLRGLSTSWPSLTAAW